MDVGSLTSRFFCGEDFQKSPRRRISRLRFSVFRFDFLPKSSIRHIIFYKSFTSCFNILRFIWIAIPRFNFVSNIIKLNFDRRVFFCPFQTLPENPVKDTAYIYSLCKTFALVTPLCGYHIIYRFLDFHYQLLTIFNGVDYLIELNLIFSFLFIQVLCFVICIFVHKTNNPVLIIFFDKHADNVVDLVATWLMARTR